MDAALLRGRFPDLVLRPGMQVVARVASRGEGARGAIVLAGSLMAASLPAQVRAGDTLRLTVAETSPERVVLRLEGEPVPGAPGASAPAAPGASAPAAPAEPASPPAPPPAPPPVAPGMPALERRTDLPGEDGPEGRRREGSGRASALLAYETPALGRLDLRLERGAEGLTVVIAAPGATAALARGHADELRQALERRTGAPAGVRVEVRREPFDAYA